MNYYDVFFEDFQSHIQTSDDIELLKIFKKYYGVIEDHFNNSIDTAINNCDDMLTVGNISEDAAYIFKKGFFMNDIIKSNNLNVWEIINYGQTNFYRSLKKTIYQVVENIELVTSNELSMRVE